MQTNYVGLSGVGIEYANLLDTQLEIADAASAVDHLASGPHRQKMNRHHRSVRRRDTRTRRLWSSTQTSSPRTAYPTCRPCSTRRINLKPNTYDRDVSPTDTLHSDRGRIIRENSPIHWAHRIKSPLVILWGEDKIGPPSRDRRAGGGLGSVGTCFRWRGECEG